jgi:protein MpaA
MQTFLFGTTPQNLPITATRFGHTGREILILGGVHGDEPEGVAAALTLQHRFHTRFPYALQATVVPQFNVEGILNNTRMNSNGVDLNRNLPTRDWDPVARTERYNPGPQPGSEPENKALVQYLATRNVAWILSLHSWNPMLNINGNCRREAEVIASYTGYTITEDIGYPTPGSLGTYAGIEKKIPTLTYEIERGLNFRSIVEVHVPAILEALKVHEIRP